MAKKTKQRRQSAQPPSQPKAASRAGSNAGRGFRYQDAVSAWLAVEIWAGRRVPAILIPEGGDDVELRGEEINFVQVKSRREHLGEYTEGQTVGYIEELWNRSLGSSPQPERMELVLERDAVGLAPLEGQSASRKIEGPIVSRLSQFIGATGLLSETSVSIATSPQEWAIRLIVDRLNCTPVAAQLCFAELLVRVGILADDNGRLAPKEYLGLSISDTELTIRDVLSAVDVDAIERALREGVCEPVDFLTPLNDPNFYLGVDVEPGHVAAGLVSERPQTRSALAEGIEERRAALVVGPSGAGKSALMWETASTLRHTVRWFRIRRLTMADIPSVRQLIRTFRASEDSPLGLVMDDIGRNSPESWGALLKEAMSVPGVVLLGSIREEDVSMIAERARAMEVRAEPDDELAERLWKELCEAGKTDWTGWREPWKLSNGLLLEYVHILTRGRRMEELLADQVAARFSDPDRMLELNVLRCGAWAGSANSEIDASRLAHTLSVSEDELSRALQRLIQEHLVRSPAPGVLAGLHQLRSEELLRLTHQTPLPTIETSFERVVESVPTNDLELLVADALSSRRLSVSAVLVCLLNRLEDDLDAMVLASSLRGLGFGRISAGIDEWLETPEACALPRTQIGLAAMIGIAGTDAGSLNKLMEVQAAANRLGRIKGSPQDDPRRMLVERIVPSSLSIQIKEADLASLDEILGALVGVPLPAVVLAALRQVPTTLLSADLKLLGSVLGTLAVLDREIALHWVAEVGQDVLFTKIETETAWAGPVGIKNEDGEVVVHCDYWYVAGSVQGRANDSVVGLCEMLSALCPSADIAISNAITASGELAGLGEHPLATKRMPRKNLPPACVSQWNRRWHGLVSRRVAAPNYSDYLSRGVEILDALMPVLEKVFDAKLRGEDALGGLFETLNLLNDDSEALTPPSVSPMEASGFGSNDSNNAVTTFQNLLHSASVNLIKRFAKLPEQAGTYIAWLNDLIADVDKAIDEEPWDLIGDGCPPALIQLKGLMETLRLLAGEAHERQEQPWVTWAKRGKRSKRGNALRSVSFAANAAGDQRLKRRKTQIERMAKEAQIEVVFHLRIDATGVLPWPPANILALLPANDIVGAVNALDQHGNQLRSMLESKGQFTVMPVIEGIAIPALARSGFQTLYPDTPGAISWVEELQLSHALSPSVGLFGEVLGLAGELGGMDQKGLGTKARPEEEITTRRSLESSFEMKMAELGARLDAFEQSLQVEVVELIEQVRAGCNDFAADAKAAFGGSSTEVLETAGYLTLLLIEKELQEEI